MVMIRHGQEADVINVREELGKKAGDRLDFSHSDIVVALEEGRMIGFGILEKQDLPAGEGCLYLREEGRRRGIGLSIVRHLFEQAGPVRMVTAPLGALHYLEDIGFRKRDAANPYGGNCAPSCCSEGTKGLVVYEKTV